MKLILTPIYALVIACPIAAMALDPENPKFFFGLGQMMAYGSKKCGFQGARLSNAMTRVEEQISDLEAKRGEDIARQAKTAFLQGQLDAAANGTVLVCRNIDDLWRALFW